MSYMTKESIMNRLHEHYEEAEKKGELFGVFLRGSQNYIDDLFLEGSDVDSLAVYLPNKKDICLAKDISQPELILSNGEHIDRFDIRKFISLLKKPRINNYETLFSEYFIINEKYEDYYNKLIEMREKISRSNEKAFLMSIMGITQRDLKHLQKRSGGEDYDIEKYGYSRKRLSNIMRFNETAKLYIDGANFESCLKSMNQQLIYDVRRTNYFNLSEALIIAEKCNTEVYKLAKDFNGKSDNSVFDELDNFLVNLLSTKFN